MKPIVNYRKYSGGDLARCHVPWRIMTNYRKTKEIRNHRRLAIISDFSLLAPLVRLELGDRSQARCKVASDLTPFPHGVRRGGVTINPKRGKEKTDRKRLRLEPNDPLTAFAHKCASALTPTTSWGGVGGEIQ